MCAQSLLRRARQACQHPEVFFLQGLREQVSWSSYAPVSNNISDLSGLEGSHSSARYFLLSQRFRLKTSTTWRFPWGIQQGHVAGLLEAISPCLSLRAGLLAWHFYKHA